MINKAKQLKKLINSNRLEFLMEAHNGISSKIVEEVGFKGIWGSGLAISASLGLRDNNEASWTQVLDVCEFMSDSTNIPILLDGDTGFGNFNNMRRLVKKLEQRDIAGVCIEDKLFPKTNSFIDSSYQTLADIDEFCGKIKVAKDTQLDCNFSVIARVEAFIAGLGLNEAIKRAEAYRQAGADAILIHSKKNDSSEIKIFMDEWGNRHPIIIVPTKYYSTPTEVYQNMGINMVIWANHTIRASITSMQKVVKKIFVNKNISSVHDDIISIKEIFRLQKADELLEAEKKYLPSSDKNLRVVILAASQGDLGVLTKKYPKTLLKIMDNKSILDNLINAFRNFGVEDIFVVRGFGKSKFNIKDVKFIDNDNYENSLDLYSLYLARDKISKNTIISYGDIIFKEYLLNVLYEDHLANFDGITLLVDAEDKKEKVSGDFIECDLDYSKSNYYSKVRFIKGFRNKIGNKVNGEFIGLWRISGSGKKIVIDSLNELSKSENFLDFTVIDLFNNISEKIEINVKYVKGSWLDINTILDLQKLLDNRI